MAIGRQRRMKPRHADVSRVSGTRWRAGQSSEHASLEPRLLQAKLTARFVGPFRGVGVINDNAYKLEVPPKNAYSPCGQRQEAATVPRVSSALRRPPHAAPAGIVRVVNASSHAAPSARVV